MKAFTWVGVLYDYNAGSVTAIAETVEEARALILKEWGNEDPDRPETEDMRLVMMEDPIIEELPCVIQCYGSA